MFKIGVVGPEVSVRRIIELATEMEEEMKFVPYPYQEVKEVGEIVLRNDPQVDFWLFSGYIPYIAAKNTLVSDEKMVYIFSMESSISQSFLQLVYAEGKLLNSVSIDMFPTENKMEEEGLQQLKGTIQNLYVKVVDSDIDSEELIEFHYGLWKEKKTEAVLTCYPKVYEALNEAGIPVRWMTPSRIEIFQTIRIFLEKIKTSYYKDTQIGVAKMEVKDFDVIQAKVEKIYQVQLLELRMKESLIKLCEEIDGSLFDEGNGRYTIYSSRGAIEREIQTFRKNAQFIGSIVDASVSLGIGFGQTILSAEVHARKALHQSKRKTEQEVVIVQDDGTIKEAAGQESELIYSYRTDNKEYLERLKEANISVKTFNRIDSLIQKMGWEEFTTNDLATSLQMSRRNAQRIVAELLQADLLECVGEEANPERGRPIKVYRLKHIKISG